MSFPARASGIQRACIVKRRERSHLDRSGRCEAHFVYRTKQRTRETQLVERVRKSTRRGLRLFGEKLFVGRKFGGLPFHTLNAANYIISSFRIHIRIRIRIRLDGLSIELFLVITGSTVFLAFLLLVVRNESHCDFSAI